MSQLNFAFIIAFNCHTFQSLINHFHRTKIGFDKAHAGSIADITLTVFVL